MTDEGMTRLRQRTPDMLTDPVGAGFERRSRWWTWVAALVLLALGVAHAQDAACRAELERAARGAGSPPQRIATAVARAAFEALEPAYPQRREAADWDDRDAAWLDRRGWLPRAWDEDAFDADAWASLLARLQRPYGAEPRPVSGADDTASLVDDAAAALANGAAQLRPLALIGTEPGDRATVSFAAVMWNWTPYPRLLLFPESGFELSDRDEPGPLLERLGSCAWRPRAWAAASEDAVADYYFGNVESGLVLAATDRGGQRREVPSGDERAVLRFEWEPIRGASVAAVEFTGPGPGMGQVLGLVSRLRTNLGLFDVGHYLAIP